MTDPLLQYYSDETFGYDIWGEEEKLRAGLENVEEQQLRDEWESS